MLPEAARPLVVDVDDPLCQGAGPLIGSMNYEQLLAEGDPKATWAPPEDEFDSLSLCYTSGAVCESMGLAGPPSCRQGRTAQPPEVREDPSTGVLVLELRTPHARLGGWPIGHPKPLSGKRGAQGSEFNRCSFSLAGVLPRCPFFQVPSRCGGLARGLLAASGGSSNSEPCAPAFRRGSGRPNEHRVGHAQPLCRHPMESYH